MLRGLSAFLLSLVGGLLLVQFVAEAGYGDQTLIAAYILTPLVALVSIAILGLAGRGERGLERLDRLSSFGVAVFFMFGFALAAMEVWTAGVRGLFRSLPVILAIAGASMFVVAVQWLILRRGALARRRVQEGGE
jgi:hypothetical protein